eukprot:scaffold5060_cov123-Isochrysis_galbana.AAC.1
MTRSPCATPSTALTSPFPERSRRQPSPSVYRSLIRSCPPSSESASINNAKASSANRDRSWSSSAMQPTPVSAPCSCIPPRSSNVMGRLPLRSSSSKESIAPAMKPPPNLRRDRWARHRRRPAKNRSTRPAAPAAAWPSPRRRGGCSGRCGWGW